MDPDEAGPTALCVTDRAAREAHQWASDVPGGPQSAAVVRAHNEARFWCDRCEVRDVCLSFALAAEGRTDERARDGVYGGVGPAERALIAGRGPKKFPPIACKVCKTSFVPGSPSARYCSDRCFRTATYKRQNEHKKAQRAAARAARAA
jgi:hypothetical protein